VSGPADALVPFRAGAVAGTAAVPSFAPAAAAPGVLLSDVSAWQANIADAAYLRWSRAVAVRAMYGTTVDRAWYGGARRDNLHAGGALFIGIYQYLVAGQDAGAQARALVNLVANLRQGEKLVCDIEEGPADQQAARWQEWSAVITGAYGPAADPWLYAGLNFAAAAGLSPQWLAAYRAAEPPGSQLLWQFSSSYPVPGVGTADCSLFHGTIDELAALGWQGTPVSPPPPADWTYGAPRNLAVTPGHHDFHAAWSAPAGAPAAPDHYLLWVYQGTACNRQTLVAKYPRDEHGTATSPDPGGLTPGTTYTLHVSAFGPGGAHSAPDVFASAVFTTGT
jgi:GH25 family lysozyme M1 (1,4-beta-N-acetylmuramidase)